MVLNQATDYALRITLFLVRQKEGDATIADTICTSEAIPKRFLFKIMVSLTKAGIVKSVRGRNGGFMIGRDPEKISLYDIIEAVEGPIALKRCLVSADKCNKNATEYCTMHKRLTELREDLVCKFRSTNMKMLV